MFLSIITVNKNNSNGLEKTIQSVIIQTFTDFEYLIIDGASEDNSVEIIKKYANKINYWISEPDTGIYNAMNKGIHKSKGDYCLFLNSGDCLISATTLHDIFREIKNKYLSDIYYTDRINSDGSFEKYPENLSINYLLDHPISHQNSFIKRSLFLEHDYYNENHRISSDWEFYLKEIWKYKSTFTYIKIPISIFDIHGIGSQDTFDRFSEMLTVYHNVFHELADTIIEINNYHKITHRNVIEEHGNNLFLVFLLRLFKYSLLVFMKLKNITNKFFKILLVIFHKYFIILYEIFTSVFNKSIRICFTNFQDIPYDFFLLPLSKLLTSMNIKYRINKYFNPHIQFFSVFGKKNKINDSNALCKIFYTGENTNQEGVSSIEYKGNCIDKVSLSLGFDYIKADNYIRLPLWLLYYFSPENTKDQIRKTLNVFKKPFQKSKFCSLVASHDRSGIRTNIYNDISKISHVDCPGNLLHNDNTLHNLYKNNKSIYLQQYKFNICPENSISPGYVTEKLFESLYSGCIPIYNGWSKDPEPDIVNSNIILWYDLSDNENNNYLMKQVQELYSNEKLYRSFIEQPFFCDTAVDKIYMLFQKYSDKIQEVINNTLKNRPSYHHSI